METYYISDYLSDVFSPSPLLKLPNLSTTNMQQIFVVFLCELNESCVHIVDVAYGIVFGLRVKTPHCFYAWRK